jgi:diacylglycerol kinase (ATP)
MQAIAVLAPGVKERVLEPFRSAGVRITIAADAEPADALLIFGGDGSVHRQLAFLRQTDTPALVVPHGSGNDFAQSIGMRTPGDAQRAWQRFVAGDGNVRTIDLGSITPLDAATMSPIAPSRLYCCVAGAGLDSDTNARANRLPRWLRSRGGYLLTAFWSMLRVRPFHVTCVAAFGDFALDEPATFIAIANAPSYGGGMLVAPRAKLDDALLDVCFVRRASRVRLLLKSRTIFSGSHLDMPEVTYTQVSEVTIATNVPRAIYADGEYCCETPATLAVLPHSLNVII